MSIRLSNAQITRFEESILHYEYIKWQGKIARETFIEDILNIVLPKEELCPQVENKNVSQSVND